MSEIVKGWARNGHRHSLRLCPDCWEIGAWDNDAGFCYVCGSKNTPVRGWLYAAHEIQEWVSKPTNDRLRRTTLGALKEQLRVHGPITAEWTGSATKRITSAIINSLVGGGAGMGNPPGAGRSVSTPTPPPGLEGGASGIDGNIQPTQEPREEWRPIETAPKDGTVVDVWLGDADEIERAFYCTGGTRRSPGWWWYQGKWRPNGGLTVFLTLVQPTHWQPLPAPPTRHSTKEDHDG